MVNIIGMCHINGDCKAILLNKAHNLESNRCLVHCIYMYTE